MLMNEKNNNIRNGVPWHDIDGKRMHAQFPHILYINDKYYLYGSNKEFSKGDNGIWHWGIRMYESEDMYNWNDCGLIIPPDTDNENSILNPNNNMDAPNIIYNEKTGKYVCWLINMMKQSAYTYTSDSLFGPYVKACEDFFPCGLTIGDFDLAKDDDGRAYIYFTKPHTEVICAELTDDYTNVKGEYKAFLKHPESVPYNRESPAYMRRNGKHYLITSGTTTYFPNPSEVAVCDEMYGEFVNIGNPHIDDDSNTSFHSQIRSIFKVPRKKDLYIALADRWLPDYMDIPYDTYRVWHEICYGSKASQEDKDRIVRESNGMIGAAVCDVSKAEYVFLPIMFEKDKPVIKWLDSWSLDDYE